MTEDEQRHQHRRDGGTQPEDERRHAVDIRFRDIDATLAVLKTQMEINTVITMQIKDILTSFRVLGVVTKWTGIMVGGIVAIYHGVEAFRK